jgi:hypothetical protein
LPAPGPGGRELLFIKPLSNFGEGALMQRLLLRLELRTDFIENRLGGTAQPTAPSPPAEECRR